jgi:hypothetical protein
LEAGIPKKAAKSRQKLKDFAAAQCLAKKIVETSKSIGKESLILTANRFWYSIITINLILEIEIDPTMKVW